MKIIPRLTPFSYSFSTTTGNTGTFTSTFFARARELHSLTIEVETDNVGPVLVSAHILVEGKKHKYGQPTGIYDGDGINAKSFDRQEVLPLSRVLPNCLVINWSNYCGDDAVIKFAGTVKR